MPSYLSSVFHIAIVHNGAISATASLAHGLCGALAAPASNWMIQKCHCRAIVIRKLFQSVAMFGPALCLGLIPAVDCSCSGVTGLLVGAMLLMGFTRGGEWTLISEYAPNSVSTVFCFANILAFAMGMTAPYVVGILLDSDPTTNCQATWNVVFYCTAALLAFGGVTFALLGTDKQQEWDKFEDTENLDQSEDFKWTQRDSNHNLS